MRIELKMPIMMHVTKIHDTFTNAQLRNRFIIQCIGDTEKIDMRLCWFWHAELEVERILTFD